MSRLSAIIIALIVSLLPVSGAVAEPGYSQRLGEYRIYYNAFDSTFLSPEIARAYGIKRSANRGVLNVSVQRTSPIPIPAGFPGMPGIPVQATIVANATNLNNQIKSIGMRQILDHGAIYYIGEFPISNEETLDFHVLVRPQSFPTAADIRFRQRFFVTHN